MEKMLYLWLGFCLFVACVLVCAYVHTDAFVVFHVYFIIICVLAVMLLASHHHADRIGNTRNKQPKL